VPFTYVALVYADTGAGDELGPVVSLYRSWPKVIKIANATNKSKLALIIWLIMLVDLN